MKENQVSSFLFLNSKGKAPHEDVQHMAEQKMLKLIQLCVAIAGIHMAGHKETFKPPNSSFTIPPQRDTCTL